MSAVPEERQALHSEWSHVAHRVAYGILLAVFGFAALVEAWRSPMSDWRDAAYGVGFFAIVFFALRRTCFATARVYANARGVQIVGARSRSRIIAWERVGDVQRAWWSRSPTSRVGVFTVQGEPRPVYFYTNQLEQFRQLRLLAGVSEPPAETRN
jgi:hypothetical protein